MNIKSLKDISYKDSSFGLVRTNPLITGNIKFTVDSKNGIWLNSIDANTILAQDMFKKFPVNLTRSYPSNVKTFFNQKNVSTDIIYDVFSGVDPSKVSHDYKDQYDFSFYFSGAKYLNSVQYNERFSYFAPLYVNKCDIPEYFIIFKIPGALNDNIKVLDENQESKYSNSEYLYDMMKNSEIVKTYSMKVGTALGDYMRNKIFNDSLFPTEPLNVNFNKDSQTIWYGLNIKSGVYCGMGEYLYEYYKSEHTLKDFEYYITCGYKRNGLLYPNIINMEFLFDDDTSELFDHNRYFGMYVNSADIARMGIDFNLLKLRQDDYGNTPTIYNDIDEFGKKSTVINNQNGCVAEMSIVDSDYEYIDRINEKYINILHVDDNTPDSIIRIPYLKDKYDNLHSIRIIDDVNKINKKINFIEKTINTKKFSGSDEIVDISGNGLIPMENGRCSVMIHIEGTPSNGDVLNIYYKGGSRVDSNGNRYDAIFFNNGLKYKRDSDEMLYGNVGEYYTNVQNYDLISIDNEFRGEHRGSYDFGKSLDKLYFKNVNEYYEITEVSSSPISIITIKNEEKVEITISSSDFSKYIGYGIQKRADGDLYLIKDIDTVTDNLTNYYSVGVSGVKFDMNRFMSAVVACINEFPVKDFSPYYNNGDLILVSNSYYSEDGDISIKFETSNTKYSYLGNYDSETGMIKSYGSTKMNNILLVPNDFEERVMDNFNGPRDYLVRSKSGYSKISAVIHYASNFDRSQNHDSFINAYDIYKNYIGLVLEKDELPEISASKFEITKVYRPYIGVCSFYKIKDFDFDYHSTDQSKIPSDEYKCKFFAQPGDKLSNLVIYGVVSDNKTDYINFRGQKFNVGDLFIVYEYKDSEIKDDTRTEMYYTIGSGDAFIIPIGKLLFDNIEDDTDFTDELRDGYGNAGVGIGDITYIYYVIRDGSIIESVKSEEHYDSDIIFSGYDILYGYGEGARIKEITSDEFYSYIESQPRFIPYGIVDKSNDFKMFDGFSSLSYSDDSSYNANSVSYMFRDRYLKKSGFCEYDYNKENDNPQYAYFSNTVGCSCKFAYLNGTDIHNNPYRLNTSHIFGKTNISPSFDKSEIDSNVYSNEWFYIVNDIESDNFINQKVFDWNETTGEISLNENFSTESLIRYNVKTGANEYYYSDILYSSASKRCVSFFRGSLIGFDETDSNGVVIENSKKYDGYKFTAILQAFPEKHDIYGNNIKPPFEFVMFEDSKNKLIVLGIILYLGACYDAVYFCGYKSSDKSAGIEYNYEDITSSNNVRMNAVSDISNYKKAVKGYHGDYRFFVNDAGYISNITYSDFYAYESKKYNTNIVSLSHTNISLPLKYNKANSSISISEDLHYGISGFKEFYNTFGLTAEMSDKFNSDSPLTYMWNDKYNDRLCIFDLEYGSGINIVSNSTLSMGNSLYQESQSSYDKSKLENNIDEMFSVIQMFGGSYYYDRIFRWITLNGIRSLFSKGTFVQSDINMSMSFLADSIISKSYVITNEDIYDNEVIGYTNSEKKLMADYTMHRMQGQYAPVFKDVFYFYNDLYNGVVNGMFADGVEGFADIKNFGHLKISDKGSNIFSYENSTIHDLKYPYIGECTVDYSDMNMMHTSWDVGFHKKYITKTSYEPVFGTLRREEDDTYVNNLIKLPNSVELSKFDVSEVSDITSINYVEYDIAYNSNYKNTSKVNGFIYVGDVIIDKLIDMGIYKSFDLISVGDEELQKKYTESNIDDYIRSYIRINILPLYEISSVSSYYRINNSIDCFSVSESDYNDYARNVKLNRDVKINKTGDKFRVDFSLPVNYDKNMELFFDVKLKLR